MEITEGGKRQVSTGYIPLRTDTRTWVAKQNAAQVQVLGHCGPEQDMGLGKEMCAGPNLGSTELMRLANHPRSVYKLLVRSFWR